MSQIIAIPGYKNPFTYKGGMEIFVKNIAKGLQKSEFTVYTFYHFTGGSTIQEDMIDGIMNVGIPVSSIFFLSDWQFAFRFNTYIQKLMPDLILDNTCISFLTNTQRYRVMSVIHGNSYGNFRSIEITNLRSFMAKVYRYFWVLIQRYYTRKVYRVVAISDKMRQENHNYYGVPHDRMINISNGTYISLSSEEYGYIASKPLTKKIIFISTDHRWKGISIVEACARALPDIQFQIYGYTYCGEIPNIEYCGLADEQGLKQAMLDADICILPSRYEGQSLALLDAIAMGLPILISSEADPYIGDMKNFGKVVHEKNVSEYIRWIEWMYNQDMDLWKDIRMRNMDIMKQYSWKNQIKYYIRNIKIALNYK